MCLLRTGTAPLAGRTPAAEFDWQAMAFDFGPAGRERLETIFDDFVTTKKRGLGLGLAIAKRIVEQLDGTIAVTSEVGHGTTFTMRFPLTRARPEQLAS